MLEKVEQTFPFKKGDVILAKTVKEIYYAKIVSINYKKNFAKLLFDDNSEDDIEFENIFSVNETTAEIICVMCKEDRADADDDIVLCDDCSIGYHQKCHQPCISSDILLPEVPWTCYYCENNKMNPYVQKNPFHDKENEKQKTTCEEENGEPNKNEIQNFESGDSSISYNENIPNNESKDILAKRLNHRETSAFNLFIKKTEDGPKREVIKEERVTSEEKRFSNNKCTHHDMVNNNDYQYNLKSERDNKIMHCQHSDIFKKLLGKGVKTNRVSPWIRELNLLKVNRSMSDSWKDNLIKTNTNTTPLIKNDDHTNIATGITQKVDNIQIVKVESLATTTQNDSLLQDVESICTSTSIITSTNKNSQSIDNVKDAVHPLISQSDSNRRTVTTSVYGTNIPNSQRMFVLNGNKNSSSTSQTIFDSLKVNASNNIKSPKEFVDMYNNVSNGSLKCTSYDSENLRTDEKRNTSSNGNTFQSSKLTNDNFDIRKPHLESHTAFKPSKMFSNEDSLLESPRNNLDYKYNGSQNMSMIKNSNFLSAIPNNNFLSKSPNQSILYKPAMQSTSLEAGIDKQFLEQKKWINEHRKMQPTGKVIDQRIDVIARELESLKQRKESVNETNRVQKYRGNVIDMGNAYQKNAQKNGTFLLQKTSPVLRTDLYNGNTSSSVDNQLPVLRTDVTNSKFHHQNLSRNNTAASYSKKSSPSIGYYDNPEANDNLLLTQLQQKHDESEKTAQINFERKRLHKLAELRKLCMDREVPLSRQEHAFRSNQFESKKQTPPSYNYRATPSFEDRISPPSNLSRNDSLKRTSTDPYNSRMTKFPRISQPINHDNSSLFLESARNNTVSSVYNSTTPRNKSVKSQHSNVKKECAFCNDAANFLCSECRTIWYCSKNCQLSHWKRHSQTCKRT